MSEFQGGDPRAMVAEGMPLHYAISAMGVSPDIAYMDSMRSHTLLATLLAERQAAFTAESDWQTFAIRHQELKDANLLPPHLQDEGQFAKRALELVGVDDETLIDNEVATAVSAHYAEPSTPERQQFEQTTAHIYMAWLNELIEYATDDSSILDALYESVVITHPTTKDHKLMTADDLIVALPQNHYGIIQYAPLIPDIAVRLSEVQHGYWAHTALLGSSAFNAAFAHEFADNKNIPDTKFTAYGEGLVAGIDALRGKMHKNPEMQRGFGAIIVSEVLHLKPPEVTAAIQTAPRFLAPGGVLVISDFIEAYDTRGYSLWNMVEEAQGVFGHEPDILRSMTDVVGQQAAFIKRA